jgi:hypothetical protein
MDYVNKIPQARTGKPYPPQVPADSEFLTKNQAARIVQVSLNHFDQFVGRDFPVVKIGRLVRIPRKPFEAWLEGLQQAEK